MGRKVLMDERRVSYFNFAPLPIVILDFSLPSACPLPWPLADYAKGFGGKYGVDTDNMDKSAVSFDYQGKTERHESQKGGYLHRHNNNNNPI